MRILGTGPSLVILSHKSSFKTWKGLSQRFQNKVKQKGLSINFNTDNFDALKRYESAEIDRKP